MQKDIIKLFWNISKANASKRNAALFFPIIAVGINVIIAPYILSQFINRLQAGGISFSISWQTIALYGALVFIGEGIMWRIVLYFTWTFEIDGLRQVYLTVFKKLSSQTLAFHAERFGGSMVSQSSKLIGSYERFWDMIIWSIMPMLITVIGSVITLSILGLWQYGIFLMFYAITFGTVVYFVSRFLNIRNLKEADASNKNSGFLADMVTNISTVKAFGRETFEQKGATKTINNWHSASTHLKWGVLGATSIFSTMNALGSIGAFLFAVLAAEHGIASAGLVYLIFVYALNVNRQLWEFNNITRTYARVIGDASEMTQILKDEPGLVDSSAKSIHLTNGKILFDQVYFAHDDGKGEAVFNDFSLTIPSGQKIGLVGHSGSGKTTLTRILLRFSEIDSGSITIDNQNITGISQQSLHESIAYVAQEPILFHRTLRENISYGKINATDAEIREAAKLAHALEFIDSLPEGLETMVGERGVKLSGGQRQRIAIARAILKDAPILVLDEATSALDSESEKLIQDSLETLMKGRTSIVIAHRLSTIAKLDRIIVLEGGKIIEDGSHKELLSKEGTYAKLWGHQSGGFIEE